MNLYLEENSNGDEELPTKKLESMKAKSTNPLDPSDKQGRASNVFGIQKMFFYMPFQMSDVFVHGLSYTISLS